jgi:serine/threonine-protein kinase RsbT
VPGEILVKIERETDIVAARQKGRELAAEIGFATSTQTVIALAISEIARNIVSYAKHGHVTLARVESGALRGISIVARDDGPGIADVELAMRDGYSTTKSLGVGLPGAKRLMDEFELTSTVGAGTTVTMKKWLR